MGPRIIEVCPRGTTYDHQIDNLDAQEKVRRLERLTDPYRLWEASDALEELKRLHAEQQDACRQYINRRALACVVDVLLKEIAWIKKETEY